MKEALIVAIIFMISILITIIGIILFWLGPVIMFKFL